MKNLFITVFIAVILISCGTENKPTYTLTTTVSPSEGGTITPSSGEFPEGEVVELTGVPASDGWRFVRWQGDWNVDVNPSSVTMNKNYNIIGVFERKNYSLNITIEGEGTVEERVVQQKSTQYPYQTVVELTPIPALGWTFEGWGGDLIGNEVPYLLTLSSEKQVTATFSSPVYLNENGVTIICPDAPTGSTGIVGDSTYEVVDRQLLIQRRDEGVDLSKVCITNVSDLSDFFFAFDVNHQLRNWDVSNVTNMSRMFAQSNFDQNLDFWNVSSVQNMSYMFSKSEFNQPLESWNTSSVTDMEGMFSMSTFNQYLDYWDVSSVQNMSYMFFQSQFNQSLSNWNVSSVTDMSWMFYFSVFNQSLSNWNVSSVTDMSHMFRQSLFNLPINDWNVSSVQSMYVMFMESQFNQALDNWNVSNVSNMAGLFYMSASFNKPLNNWNVSNVNDMTDMFNGSPFNQPLNQWCVTNIISEPNGFAVNSPLTEENKPIWGTCPTQ